MLGFYPRCLCFNPSKLFAYYFKSNEMVSRSSLISARVARRCWLPRRYSEHSDFMFLCEDRSHFSRRNSNITAPQGWFLSWSLKLISAWPMSPYICFCSWNVVPRSTFLCPAHFSLVIWPFAFLFSLEQVTPNLVAVNYLAPLGTLYLSCFATLSLSP